MKGIVINDDELGVSTIAEIGFGGNYIGHEHTYRHCRSILQTKLFYKHGRDENFKVEKIDILERARDEVHRILDESKEQLLPDKLIQELNVIIKKADQNLS